MAPALVLVVEDDFLLRMNASSLLEEAGFDVLEAANADEAIALLEARKDFRIVFTDVHMPGSMDGLRLAEAIRSRWPPIELVLTSGQVRVHDEDMPERGFFLGKPYAPNELVDTVRSFARTQDGAGHRTTASRGSAYPDSPPEKPSGPRSIVLLISARGYWHIRSGRLIGFANRLDGSQTWNPGSGDRPVHHVPPGLDRNHGRSRRAE